MKKAALLVTLVMVGLLAGTPTASAGGGCHGALGLGMSTGSETAIPVGKCAFTPTVTYVEAGDKVTWKNHDPVPHTVTGAQLSWGSERMLEQGRSVSYSFKSEGVYPYFCVLHPGMVGAVVVGDGNAEAALTNGYADVEEVQLPGAPAVETSAEDLTATASSNLGLLITLAAAVALIAGVFVTRGAIARKRAAITPSSLS